MKTRVGWMFVDKDGKKWSGTRFISVFASKSIAKRWKKEKCEDIRHSIEEEQQKGLFGKEELDGLQQDLKTIEGLFLKEVFVEFASK